VQAFDERCYRCAGLGPVALGGDPPLLDALGRFDLDVVVGGEQHGQPVTLFCR